MTLRESDTAVIVCPADDRFAVALAVMVRSLLDDLPANERLALFVIDGGIRSTHPPSLAAIVGPRPARARMAAARNVASRRNEGLRTRPASHHSIAELWRTDVSRHPLAAVQEIIVPYVSSPCANPQVLV